MREPKYTYIKTKIEEFESIFLENPFESTPFYSSPLERTISTFRKCWRKYRYEYFDDTDYEKLPIDYNDFTLESHIQHFDFNKLEEKLNYSNFEKDLTEIINENESYFYEELSQNLHSLKTDLQINHHLRNIFDQLMIAIKAFGQFPSSKLYEIVATKFKKSYIKALKHLKNEYPEYLSKKEIPEELYVSVEEREGNELLRSLIFDDDLYQFKEFEIRLKESGWIKQNEEGIQWLETKTNLIDFARYIDHIQILRPNRKLTKLIRFFEQRYNLDTDTLKKPSKFELRPLKPEKFAFLKT